MSELTTADDRRTHVGSFETLDGASRAVSHLVELDYRPEDVAIAPRSFEIVDAEATGQRLRTAIRVGAAVGALVAGATAVVGAIGLEQAVTSMLPSVLLAAVVGAVLAVLGAVLRARYLAATRVGETADELRATAFDVVVHHRPDGARHDLARWWDPAATPARRAGTA